MHEKTFDFGADCRHFNGFGQPLCDQEKENRSIRWQSLDANKYAAFDDRVITNGFQIELMRLLGEDKVRIEVQNAMGDINLQKSSINKF